MSVLVSQMSLFRRMPESSALIELDTGFRRCDGKIRGEGAPSTKTPSPSRGEGWGGGEQRTLVKADAMHHRDDLVMEPTP
jgi:hypothetical protein